MLKKQKQGSIFLKIVLCCSVIGIFTFSPITVHAALKFTNDQTLTLPDNMDYSRHAHQSKFENHVVSATTYYDWSNVYSISFTCTHSAYAENGPEADYAKLSFIDADGNYIEPFAEQNIPSSSSVQTIMIKDYVRSGVDLTNAKLQVELYVYAWSSHNENHDDTSASHSFSPITVKIIPNAPKITRDINISFASQPSLTMVDDGHYHSMTAISTAYYDMSDVDEITCNYYVPSGFNPNYDGSNYASIALQDESGNNITGAVVQVGPAWYGTHPLTIKVGDLLGVDLTCVKVTANMYGIGERNTFTMDPKCQVTVLKNAPNITGNLTLTKSGYFNS